MIDDRERLEILERAFAQMLQPLRGIPFSVIVKSLAKRAIIPIDLSSADDKGLVDRLVQAAHICGEAVRQKPIVRPRPNEVGNDIEMYVMAGLLKAGLKCERPTTAAGAGKSTGYPDILLFDADKRPTYLECKIYSAGTADTSMRSFYLSPSDEFKVRHDARHLLMAFEMQAVAVPDSRNSEYRPTAFKLIDLHDLLCDVKYEFNSDNRRLYSSKMILAGGQL